MLTDVDVRRLRDAFERLRNTIALNRDKLPDVFARLLTNDFSNVLVLTLPRINFASLSRVVLSRVHMFDSLALALRKDNPSVSVPETPFF